MLFNSTLMLYGKVVELWWQVTAATLIFGYINAAYRVYRLFLLRLYLVLLAMSYRTIYNILGQNN